MSRRHDFTTRLALARNSEGIVTAPALPAYPTAHGWRVWCCYCNRWHQHGAQPGHRVAHCYVADSPFRATGYVLELVEAER